MTTRDLIYRAMQYKHALAAYENLSERKRRKSEPPYVDAPIQAGLALIQHKDKERALQYAMDMQQLALEKPAPTASIWNDVADILAEATET